MKYLLEIEKTRHLTNAAKNLFLTQPALSRVLKKLESEFGGPLFFRDGNFLLPAPIGTIVLKHSSNKAFIVDEDFKDQPCIIVEDTWQIHSRLHDRLQKSNVTPIEKTAGKDIGPMMSHAGISDLPIVLPVPALNYHKWPGMVIRRFQPLFPWEMCLVYPNKGTSSRAPRKFTTYSMDYFAAEEFFESQMK